MTHRSLPALAALALAPSAARAAAPGDPTVAARRSGPIVIDGRVRWRPSADTSVGGTFASAIPFGPRCTEAGALESDDFRPKRCDAPAGNAAALGFTTRSHDGEWFALGQVTGSQSLGGPPTRVLVDGTALSRGELGWGAHAAAGRGGGEPWRIEGD